MLLSDTKQRLVYAYARQEATSQAFHHAQGVRPGGSVRAITLQYAWSRSPQSQ
jgi:hypothetical protein